MIVPALVLEMQRQGLGTVNSDLFWEEIPLDFNGIWVMTSGDGGSTDDYISTQVTVQARFKSKVETEMRLRAIVNWLRGDARNICELSVNPHDLDDSQTDETITYDVISISHTGAVQSSTIDDEFRVNKTITFTVNYQERSK